LPNSNCRCFWFSLPLSSLSVQLGKQYPYVVPAIELRNVKGLSKEEQSRLMHLLKIRASELSETGSAVMIELVQVVEDYLAEHNCDPNMSAWEQMKAREAGEKEKEREADEELDRLMDSTDHTNRSTISQMTRFSFLDGGEGGKDWMNMSPPALSLAASTDVERELIRQKKALDAARRVRSGQTVSFSTHGDDVIYLGDNDDVDDDFDFEDDYGDYAPQSSSRYQLDFVELGMLGRGGGGEVVKVRNRLDRRIYAVKKIILESEKGRFASYAVVQNRKLRREVTTISRMTHKNIVRYYQVSLHLYFVFPCVPSVRC
jgi:translation initiation factor 2-alpha kinase 4